MILIAYGTRPEWIKLKPLIYLLKQEKKKFHLLYTGQQKDIGSFEFDSKIEITDIDSKNRLNFVISSILNSNVFNDISYVIVQGDTASAFAVALSAFNRGIPILHIEAGLRTFDTRNPYPEESYRQMISCMARYHFCPTTNDHKNIIDEKKSGKSFVVGNTVIDSLPKIPTKYDNYVLVTMHRRENLPIMDQWFFEIEELANEYTELEFVIPIHPNPILKEFSKVFKKTKLIHPMKHEELLEFMAKCKCVISDSGGVQEEASFYKKKVLVCREITERPAKNQLLVKTPKDLKAYFRRVIDDYVVFEECPFGSGDSSEKIFKIMKEHGIC